MLRYENINDISDGKLYIQDDLVNCDTEGCKGCSKCCKSDMGKSIVLTPYDMYQLCKGTGNNFDKLLVDMFIELSMIDGIILPNMKMDEGCKFLENGRCSIHAYRPGICRLFPLGRIYEKDGFRYFLQTSECVAENPKPIKVQDWINIEELDKNTAFINKWHRFIKFEQKKVKEIQEMATNLSKRVIEMSDKDLEDYVTIVGDSDIYSPENPKAYREEKSKTILENAQQEVKDVMKTVIAFFYLDEYDMDKDFYLQLDERMKKCLKRLRTGA